MLWTYGVAEIVGADGVGTEIIVGELDGGLYVEKRADGVGYLEVEVEQEIPAALEEWTYVVGIIIENGLSP